MNDYPTPSKPSAPIVLSCRTFSVGATVVRSREVNLPYRTAGDGDTDDVSGVVVRHCAANGARSVAVAVNFNERVSRLPSAVLLLVVPDSKSVIQTDFLLQVGWLVQQDLCGQCSEAAAEFVHGPRSLKIPFARFLPAATQV